MAASDKRVFPRFAVTLAVELETADGTVHAAVSRNLSRGGVSLETAGAVAAGAEVVVRVTLVFDEERASEPLDLPARVVWCTPFADAHQLGTQFRPLSPEQQEYLDMFLRYLEEQADDEGGEDDDPFAA